MDFARKDFSMLTIDNYLTTYNVYSFKLFTIHTYSYLQYRLLTVH